MTRRVVHGEVNGTAFRAHFDGEPGPREQEFLEGLVRAVTRCLEGTCEHPACVARREEPPIERA